jgi:P pilus assembly chaperone PapD
MRYKLAIGIFLALLLALPAVSCIQTGGIAGRPEVSVVSENLTTDASGGTVLLLTVKNTGRVYAQLAEVSVKFYDTGNKLLDSNRDSVMGLNPGETWEFSIPCGSPVKMIGSYAVETTAASGSE